MATGSNELEDLITCGICLVEYDSVNRKPKFLQCSHTICQICVQRISSSGFITCPFCRHKFANDKTLPNNKYALQLLKLKENDNQFFVTCTTGTQAVNSWCFHCGKSMKPLCASSAHAVLMTTEKTLRNIESLHDIDKELEKVNSLSVNTMTSIIDKHYQVQRQLNLVSTAINIAGDRTKQLQTYNNLLLAKVLSNVEKNCFSTPTKKNEKYSVELHPLGIVSLNNHFKLEKLIFVVKLFNLDVRVAELHFRPASSFRFQTFVRQLAQFCHKSPKTCDQPIEKAVPETFVLFRMSYQSFSVTLPSRSNSGANNKVCVESSTEIGIFLEGNPDGSSLATVNNWSLLFPLASFQDPNRQLMTSRVSNAELFGHVVHNAIPGSITNLSRSKNSNRTNYSLTLESRYESE